MNQLVNKATLVGGNTVQTALFLKGDVLRTVHQRHNNNANTSKKDELNNFFHSAKVITSLKPAHIDLIEVLLRRFFLHLMRIFILFSAFTLLLAACGGDDSHKNDPEVARVYDKILYASEVSGGVPPGTSPQDSSLLVGAFVQRWISEQLLMYEAERNIPKDANIDKLVRDYRASLVRFNFEEDLIAQKLDSVVNEDEVRRFYEDNKEQFELQSTILKCIFVKMPSDAPQSEMNKLWSSRSDSDEAKLEELAKQLSVLALLDRKKWYRLDEIAALLPQGTLSADNVSSRKEGTLNDGGFRYYYRVLESVRGKETAPYDYVKEQASKVILHHRKQDLLDKWKKELYDNELRRGNIKVK